MTEEFGKGYGLTQIKNFKRFYLQFKYIDTPQTKFIELNKNGQTLSDQLVEKGQTLSAEFELAKYLPSNLSWSHYERLIRVEDDEERDWYMKEGADENWSVRQIIG